MTTLNESLGSRKKKFVFSCQGTLTEAWAEDFAREFIKLAGMTPARRGRIDPYPYKGGGGEGWTGFFPLMESYLVIDVYSDLREVEIVLSTCKPERIELVRLVNFLCYQIGPLQSIGVIDNRDWRQVEAAL